MEMVVIGIGGSSDYCKLSENTYVVMKPNRTTTCNVNTVFLSANGAMPLGCGALVASIECCSGEKADVTIGKQSPIMLETGQDMECGNDEFVVIRDNLQSDMSMAKDVVLKSFLSEGRKVDYVDILN